MSDIQQYIDDDDDRLPATQTMLMQGLENKYDPGLELIRTLVEMLMAIPPVLRNARKEWNPDTDPPFLVLMPKDANRQKSWTTVLKNAEAIRRAADEGRNDFDPEDIGLVHDHIDWALDLDNQKKFHNSADEKSCEGMSMVFERLRELKPTILDIMIQRVHLHGGNAEGDA